MKYIHKLIFTMVALFPAALSAQPEIGTLLKKETREEQVYLEEKPRSFKVGGTVTFKADEPLPVYGVQTDLCFGFGERFEGQKSFEDSMKLQDTISVIFFGSQKTEASDKNEAIRFSYTDMNGVQSATQESKNGSMIYPKVLDKEKGIRQMVACFPVNPVSDTSVQSVSVTFTKSFDVDSIFWSTSNQAEIVLKWTAQEEKKNNKKVILEKEERLYKAGEVISFTIEEPLIVLGRQTSLCFVVGRENAQEREFDKKAIRARYLSTADPSGTSDLEGGAETIDGEKFSFKTSLSYSWEMTGFTGDVKMCTQLQNVSAEAKPVKSISFTPKVDINALSVEWRTSDNWEKIEEAWQREQEEAKVRPFVSTEQYKELVEHFPGDGEVGTVVLEAPNMSFTKSNDIHSHTETYGLHLSFSDSAFLVAPKDAEQVKGNAIKVSAKDIHSCTARFFGTIHSKAILVIEEPEYYIETDYADEFFEWCWKNKIPVLPQRDFSKWSYEREPLPKKIENESQFESLGAYMKHLKKSCSCR